jgi:hypothetical protein
MKRPSLADVLNEPSILPDPQPPQQPVQQQAQPAKPAKRPQIVRNQPPQPSSDIVRTSIYISRESHERLREIAFATRRRVHSLIVEGIDKVVADYGHSESARVKLGPKSWKRLRDEG